MQQQTSDLTQILFRLKREQPFRAFDVVTRDGKRYHVARRFEFAHTDSSVIVANEKRTAPIRLPLDTVASISEIVTN